MLSAYDGWPGDADEVEALICYSVPIDKPLMDRLPALRVIGKRGAGVDTLDLDEIVRRGIKVTNVGAGGNANSVCEQALTLLMAATRDVVARDAFTRAGNFLHRFELPLYQEVAGSRVGIMGAGQIGRRGLRDESGSYWGARVAPTEPGIKAAVLQWPSVTDPARLFAGSASPRYKHVLAYVTRSNSEDEVDAFIAQMPLGEPVGKIAVPTLTAVGEFDQRSPLPAVYEFFDALTTPGELWVFSDQHHQVTLRGKSTASSTGGDSHALGMDWLKDRFLGKPMARPGEVTYIESNGLSPSDPRVENQALLVRGGLRRGRFV